LERSGCGKGSENRKGSVKGVIFGKKLKWDGEWNGEGRK
jgi:hypothetical protein